MTQVAKLAASFRAVKTGNQQTARLVFLISYWFFRQTASKMLIAKLCITFVTPTQSMPPQGGLPRLQ